MSLLNFDATQVAPAQALEPIPAGWYDAKIIASEVKPTSNGSGTRLNLTYEIIGGEFNARKVWEGLNIKNASEKAQQIGQEQLSAICHAIGVLNLQRTEQLHGIPHKIQVKVRAADGNYDARNEIKGWENINGKKGSPASGPAAAARPAGPAPGQRPSGPAPGQRPAQPQGGQPAAQRPQPPAQQQRPAQPQAQQRPPQQQAQRPQPTQTVNQPTQPVSDTTVPVETGNFDQEQPWNTQDAGQAAHDETMAAEYADAGTQPAEQYAQVADDQAPWDQQ